MNRKINDVYTNAAQHWKIRKELIPFGSFLQLGNNFQWLYLHCQIERMTKLELIINGLQLLHQDLKA